MPISFVGWIEALGCDWGIDSIGGHLIYDATIPICLGIFIIWSNMMKGKY